MAHRVRMHLLKRRLLFTYLLYTKVVHVLLFPMHTLTECELFTQNVDGVLYVYLFGQVVHTCSSHGYIHNSLHNISIVTHARPQTDRQTDRLMCTSLPTISYLLTTCGI